MTHHAPQPTFAVTVDVTLFGLHHDTLHILLVQRKYPPFAGSWALPGGFVEPDEDLVTAAQRELYEESGVTATWLEQLHTFGAPGRDPRRRTISIAHLGICAGTPPVTVSDETPRVVWHPVSADISLAFDHQQIVETALIRLRQHTHHLAIMGQFLQAPYTAQELHRLYECIMQTPIDQTHFVTVLHAFLAAHGISPDPHTHRYPLPITATGFFAWDSLVSRTT